MAEKCNFEFRDGKALCTAHGVELQEIGAIEIPPLHSPCSPRRIFAQNPSSRSRILRACRALIRSL